MSNKKRILVFTACYNEKPNIEKLILEIKKNLPNSFILVVDDNSPDETKEVVKNLQKKISHIDLVVRDKKLGLDTAHKLAYDYAIKNDFDYLITMDADLSHDPIELSNFIDHLNDHPFVLGSRYMPGGRCLMRGSRLIISKLGNLVIRFFSGINCKEFTTSYRGFDIKKLESFNLNNVNDSGYSFFMGTLFEIKKKGFQIKEIPITLYDREQGASKVPKIEIFRTLINLIKHIIKNTFN